MTKTMIAIKDIGETIKVGDEVTVVDIVDMYAFFEYELLAWKSELGIPISDESKKKLHKIDRYELYDYFRELSDEESLVGYCNYCDCEIERGDEFLLYAGDDDYQNIYCHNCVESYTVTSFSIGGEHLGTDDDGWDFETV